MNTGLKLLSDQEPTDISIADLPENTLAIITQWGSLADRNIGNIVIRFKDDIIAIGHGLNGVWGSICTSLSAENYRVRTLPKGSKFELWN